MEIYIYGEKRAATDELMPYAEAAETAVVTIDFHEGHLSTDPGCPCPAPRMRELIEPINQFHQRARDLEIPVIHVKTVLRKDGADDLGGGVAAWRQLFPLLVGEIPNIDQHAIEGTRWTEFSNKIDPSDYIVQTKKRLSIFYPTDLDFLLRNLRVRNLILTGGMTDCCVLNAAFEASNHDYKVIVLQDLVRGLNDDMEDAALKMMSIYTGLVMDSDDLLAEWDAQASAAKPVHATAAE